MSRILPSSLLLALLLSACTTPHSDPTFVAPEGQSRLVRRIRGEIHDLERRTGRRFRGETIEVHQPATAHYSDWRGMPVAKIRGRGNFEVEIKSDQTPVTVADRSAEEIIRRTFYADFSDSFTTSFII